MTPLERFLAVMEYQPADRVPNWELGTWSQTRTRWEDEGADLSQMHWDWFTGVPWLGMDPREFIPCHAQMNPGFQYEVLEEEADTQVIRDATGRVRRVLRPGERTDYTRASMDQFLRFPVTDMADWQAMKRRYDPHDVQRFRPGELEIRPSQWPHRTCPLIFAPNCGLLGFYWIARDWMGTEALSLAWYDQPEMMHDMMAFWGDFIIEAARPTLEVTDVEYVNLNEDFAMKNGPLLSPDTYRTFIYPHLKRVVEFLKSHGVRYVSIDSDGNPELLIPLLMDAGVDVIWPLERTAGQDPIHLRKKFGKSLRMWGGVDKRALARGPAAIDEHLQSLAPAVEAGGYIPSVDHTVPPDVSWNDFQYYMTQKEKLLRGQL